MEVFRLSKKKYASSLSGIGAAMYGARWNSKGTELIYTARNRSLAMAQVAVHFSLGTMTKDYMMLTIYIPDHISLLKVSEKDLPKRWNIFPHSKAPKLIGNDFYRAGGHCLMEVPSAVTPGDFNLLLHPYHPEFKEIKIIDASPFPFDNRLF